MKLTTIKSLVATAMVAAGFAAVAAPKVTIDRIEDTSVWSTKKVTYTVSDAPAADSISGYLLAFDVTAYSVTTNIKMGVAQNGTFTYTLDTAAIFGETRKDPQAKFRVSLEKEFDMAPVQLWEGGPYFASCNVGANAPQESGYYFWWGDTVGYVRNAADDGWVSSKDGTTSITFDSNNPPANLTSLKSASELKSMGYIDDVANPVLNAAHDAATVHWGAPWRMMTSNEVVKLASKDYCRYQWVTEYKGKSVPGYVVKGKAGTPYENNEVFFPAAGQGERSDLNLLTRIDQIPWGCHWSSFPYEKNDLNSYFIYYVPAGEDGSSGFYYSITGRFCGHSVRPVR